MTNKLLLLQQPNGKKPENYSVSLKCGGYRDPLNSRILNPSRDETVISPSHESTGKKKHGFHVVHVPNRSIFKSADEIIGLTPEHAKTVPSLHSL
jgi:hypothetical protein